MRSAVSVTVPMRVKTKASLAAVKGSLSSCAPTTVATDSPDVRDLEALRANEAAQSAFDSRLTISFAPALSEVAGLGYPNNSDPSIKVESRLALTYGMDHETAVLFDLDSVMRQRR